MAGREEGRGAGPVALAKIMSISWKAIRHRAEWFLVKLAAFLIPLCPRRWIVWIGSPFGSFLVVWGLAGWRRGAYHPHCALLWPHTPPQRDPSLREPAPLFYRHPTNLF